MEEVQSATARSSNLEESRVERIEKKSESFMIQVLTDLESNLLEHKIDFDILSASEENMYLNSFLAQKFPDASVEYREEIKTEIVNSINRHPWAFLQ